MLRLGGVAAALASLWPSYVGYAISFIVIGIMWANHHNLMKLVARVDHGFLTLTLLLLMASRSCPCDYTRLRARVDAVSAGHTTRLCPCGAESGDRRGAGDSLHASEGRRTRPVAPSDRTR